MHLYLKTKLLDSATRLNLMRSHPAIVAHLFDYKQDCIWKYLVMGDAKPFGEVTDYWRRVEVIILFMDINYCIWIFICLS